MADKRVTVHRMEWGEEEVGTLGTWNMSIYDNPAWARASPVAQTIKILPAMQETQVWSLGREDPLEKEMATHPSILAWRFPWTEEPGELQSTGSQRVRRDWVINTFTASARRLSWWRQQTGWKGCAAESKITYLIIRHPAWSLLLRNILLEASLSSLLQRTLQSIRAASQRLRTKGTIISRVTVLVTEI